MKTIRATAGCWLERFEVTQKVGGGLTVHHLRDRVIAWRIEPDGFATALTVAGPIEPTVPEAGVWRASFIVDRSGDWNHYSRQDGLNDQSRMDLSSIAMHKAKKWLWRRAA